MRLNESGLSLFRSEEIQIRKDNKLESESVVTVCSSLQAHPNAPPPELMDAPARPKPDSW